MLSSLPFTHDVVRLLLGHHCAGKSSLLRLLTAIHDGETSVEIISRIHPERATRGVYIQHMRLDQKQNIVFYDLGGHLEDRCFYESALELGSFIALAVLSPVGSFPSDYFFLLSFSNTYVDATGDIVEFPYDFMKRALRSRLDSLFSSRRQFAGGKKPTILVAFTHADMVRYDPEEIERLMYESANEFSSKFTFWNEC